MCIKGIGDKKADSILKYRKSNKLKSAKDLLEIKGFGKALVKNVEKDVKSVACGGTKSTKVKSSKESKKKTSKATKKSDKKEKKTTKSDKKSSKTEEESSSKKSDD